MKHQDRNVCFPPIADVAGVGTFDAGVRSNLGAFSERERILDIDAEIAHRAFDLRVAE